MRVNPAKNRKRIARPILLGLVLTAAAVALFSAIGIPTFPKAVSQSVAPTELTVQVLVARRAVQVGSYFDDATLVFEGRTQDTIPEDAVTSLSAVQGKVALATLSRGTIISKSYLGEPITVLPSQFEPIEVAPEVSLEAAKGTDTK